MGNGRGKGSGRGKGMIMKLTLLLFVWYPDKYEVNQSMRITLMTRYENGFHYLIMALLRIMPQCTRSNSIEISQVTYKHWYSRGSCAS